jgi:hypothetical protein
MKAAPRLARPEGYFASGLAILTTIFADYAAFNG